MDDSKGTKRKRSEHEKDSAELLDSADKTPSYEALQRLPGEGMNPKSILMGIYGPRGEKIRHTVHQGSMKLPGAAIEILQDVQDTCIQNTKEHPTKKFQLPAIDGVIRPTLDNEHHHAIVITELTATENPPPPPPMPVQTPQGLYMPPPQQPYEKWTTHARNWKLKLPSKEEVEAKLVAAENSNNTAAAAEGGPESTPGDGSDGMEVRIRGGGGKGDEDVVMEEAKEETTNTPAVQGGDAAAAFAPPTSPPKNAGEQTIAAAEQKTVAPTMQTGTAAPSFTTSAPVSVGTAAAAAATSAQPVVAAPTAAATTTTAPAPTPSVTVSSTTTTAAATAATTKAKVPAVIPLPSVPKPQWEQLQAGPNDEMQTEPKTPRPSWYAADKVSDLERALLPEWFNESATHRTEETFIQARERILQIAEKLASRHVSSTLIRRTVPGDAGSLLRLYKFLNSYGLINEDAINDSMPTPQGYRQDEESSKKTSSTSVIWNETSRGELMEAVVDESTKKRLKTNDGTSASCTPPIDWNVVAKRVGNGASAADCEKVFLALPLEAAAEKVNEHERSITPDVTSSEQQKDKGTTTTATGDKTMNIGDSVLNDLVDKARPEVVKAVTDAALAATDNIEEAQQAGLLALAASEAATRARQEEDTVARLLAELQEQRLQKLENRMAMLDDIEAVLEAERVALELERRDLYTARCRHWFGGAS